MRLRVIALVLVLGSLPVALWLLDPFGWSADAGLHDALVQRGRVAVYGDVALAEITAEGASLVPSSGLPAVAAALIQGESSALRKAMRVERVDAILVDTRSPAPEGTLAGGGARYATGSGFRGLHLAPEAALFRLDPAADISAAHRAALAKVARRLLGGARAPRVTSFPEPLRRLRPVEVMVMLRQGGRPRLWRSARGNSIARALNTAAMVARKRWFEREQAMGGPIDTLLPRMTVEVALLADDGTIGSIESAFIDRVFTPEHGVAYERKGAWRYKLPGATREDGQGRASVAYTKLLAEDGLPAALGAPDLRLYRLLVDTIAVSQPEPQPRDGLSPVQSPDELLAPDAGTGVQRTALDPPAGSHRMRRSAADPDDGLSEVRSPEEILRAD